MVQSGQLVSRQQFEPNTSDMENKITIATISHTTPLQQLKENKVIL
jgi:hypothetical protein